MLETELPPQNPEAEQAVIGGLLRDPRWADEVRLQGLSPDDFCRDSHRIAVRCIFALADAGKPVEPLALDDELRRRGELQRNEHGFTESMRLIHDCLDAAPHGANTGYHAAIVRELARVRSLIEASGETLRDCYSGLHTADELIASAESRVFALADRDAGRNVAPIGEAVPDVMSKMARREAGEFTGVPTGFPEFDALTDGLPDGALAILAARPSIGKTALALAICHHAAFRMDLGVLFVSLEMTRPELAERLIVIRSGVFGHKLRQPRQLSESDRRAIERAADEVHRGELLHVDDSPGRTMAEVAATARRYRSRHGIRLLVLDYIQLVDPDAESRHARDSRQEQIAKVSRRLKNLAKELGIPVLALSQLNREVEKRADKRPQLADLRESGAIEQDADMVTLLHRPDFYDPSDKPGTAELIVAKNRHGDTGSIQLRFTAGLAKFDPYAPVAAF